jgi:hypothetical protein
MVAIEARRGLAIIGSQISGMQDVVERQKRFSAS